MLWFICQMFWWQQVPGIILFTLIIPFIEIHTGVLNANSSNISLDDAFNGSGRRTFWLSSIGLLFVTLGLRSTMNKDRFAQAFHFDKIKQMLEKVTLPKLILIYFLLSILGAGVDALIPWNSSLKQLEVQVLKLPSLAIMTACLHFFIFRKNTLLFAGFITLILVQNLYSYFSEWRLPLEILITASLIQLNEFKAPQLLRYSPIAIPILLFVGLWQSIKGEYRYYLSGGLENQTITVSRTDAINTALELAAASYETGNYSDSTVIQATYQRTGYLEFFAATLRKVPAEIPFEAGKLTLSNLEYALIPRILNPDKAIKKDRTKVEKYTGIYFGGDRSTASFSLGHYCEAYIDWGAIGMMLHLFVYGCIGGWITNLFTRRESITNSIFGAGILFTVLSFWGTYQKDMITVLGSLFWGGLAFLVLFPPLLKRIQMQS